MADAVRTEVAAAWGRFAAAGARAATRRGRPAAMAAMLSALCTLGACNRGVTGPSEPVVTMKTPPGAAAQASVEIAGLNRDALAALARRPGDAASWQDVVRLEVLPADSDTSPSGQEPVAGRFRVADHVVSFKPAVPFEPGVRYRVLVDATRLHGGARAPVDVVVQRPVTSPLATVTSVVPGGTAMPENVLRVYVHFSAPMEAGSEGTVRLLDDTGLDIADPFLPVDAERWNADRTRYTVLFDPARIGSGADLAADRPLVRGRFYSLVIEDDWLDEHGRRIAAPYHHEFWAGAPLSEPLAPSRWQLTVPRAGTRDPLRVAFPFPLDQDLLSRAMHVEGRDNVRVEGEGTVGPEQIEWRFVPATPWPPGAHRLVALGILEDPAGNRLGRAYRPGDPAPARPAAAAAVPFMIAP